MPDRVYTYVLGRSKGEDLSGPGGPSLDSQKEVSWTVEWPQQRGMSALSAKKHRTFSKSYGLAESQLLID